EILGVYRIKERAVAESARIGEQLAVVGVLAELALEYAVGQAVHKRDPRSGRRGEVAGLWVVDSLLEVDGLDQLGDHAVDVEKAVQVGMVRLVVRHVVDPEGEVGAVVEEEAAQQVDVAV